MRPALTDKKLDGICKRYALQPDTIHGWDDIDGKNGSKGEIAALLLEIYRLKEARKKVRNIPDGDSFWWGVE